ncbi:ABC transporter ATP-binding protein [Clostridium sediminicola]|uniref:ABC transporter ATP-binding protein n=1 Tax=Clostridium sediminicola TaxID=3114879 RepID=UPI0031F276F5
MNNNEKLLDIKNLTIHYKTDNGIVRAVENLNLSLGKKETLGFVGETGAGKTTTALGIMQLLPTPPGEIISGQILFEGEDLLKKSPDEMRGILGEKIAMIFQDPMTSLNPVMTVGKQIAEMIELHENISKAQALKKAEDMLEVVGIRKERAADYPHQFSGGMKQRVVIAIALACNPILLIADEPTTALDVTIQAQVLELMKDLKSKYDTSMIMITHDLGVVAEICDKVAIMYAGNIVEYADKESLYLNPLHPYTIGLFDSIPDLDSEQSQLNVINGLTPDPTNLPTGCPFHPRCSKVMEKCSKMKPEMMEIEPGHFTACFLHEKK